MSARWRQAYWLAFLNSVVFVALSGLSLAAGIQSLTLNAAIAAIFMVGSIVTGISMLFVAQGPAPIGIYVLGTGVTFGFGTALAAVAPPLDYMSMLLFTHDVAAEMLGKVNFVNALSIFCVITAAWPICRLPTEAKLAGGGLAAAVNTVDRLRAGLVLASFGVIGLLFATYPIATDLLLRSLVNALSRVPLVALVVIAARWRTQPAYAKISLFAILAALIAFGVLSASKANTLLPVAAVLGGMWLTVQSRRRAIALGVLTAITYFILVAPLSERMRDFPTYNGGMADLPTSATNLSAAVGQLGDKREAPPLRFIQRFTTTPYQSYLIRQHDNGNSGESLKDVWTAMVPRVLWPEKPNITRFGAQLYNSLNRNAGSSQLSPTYTAEAYWNYGWIGLIVVSLVIGLEMGWFTRKWLNLEFNRGGGPGILVFIVPVALMAMFPEAWIAATYVGGFITLVIFITATDWVAEKFGVLRSAVPTRSPLRA
jgi:hypothetical protein